MDAVEAVNALGASARPVEPDWMVRGSGWTDDEWDAFVRKHQSPGQVA